MKEYFRIAWELLRQITVLDILDLTIMTVIVFQIIKLAKETRAYQVLKGFAILIIVSQLSKWLQLTGLSQLLSYLMNSGVVVLVVLFQPEIRRALERLGAKRFIDAGGLHIGFAEYDPAQIVEQLEKAIQAMAKAKTGALIVVQKENTLQKVVESGTLLSARVSAELIENIFFKNSPLHDGAMIVHGAVIVAAGCFLPLTSNNELSKELGTRHRAALGMSEQTDALILIVSEETGIISLAEGGKLTRYLDAMGLRAALNAVYQPKQPSRGLANIIRRMSGHE